MKKIIQKINQAVQLILLAPIKWPAKALHIIRYVSLGLRIVESVLEELPSKELVVKPQDSHGDGAPSVDIDKEENQRKEEVDET